MLKLNFRRTTLLLLMLMGVFPAHAIQQNAMKIDQEHVNNWNQFADTLYLFHKRQIKHHVIRTEQETGGYAGMPDFYKEIRYYDDDSGKLLSRIQWEKENPKQVHVIEVFVYDINGNLKSDYLAAYLPGHRNAPIQTLINIHYRNDELQSFRQFDASGNRIYERCYGRHFDEPLSISLEEDDFDSRDKSIMSILSSEAYFTCFELIPSIVTPYLSPFKSSGLNNPDKPASSAYLDPSLNEYEHAEIMLSKLNNAITSSANPGKLYIERGNLNLKRRDFDAAVSDYNQALKLDKNLDEAYFGRGMAKGRLGQIEQGIADLSYYIQRHPDSSLAYTKRGVRYIWAGDLVNAERDLKTAIRISSDNAEAHDDLGVIYASKGDMALAIEQFKKVTIIDPSYQKGFHNLAMAYHIKGKHTDALTSINMALQLSPNEKTSLLLKGEILKEMGMAKEADKLIERAEFLPEGNWSERFSVK